MTFSDMHTNDTLVRGVTETQRPDRKYSPEEIVQFVLKF